MAAFAETFSPHRTLVRQVLIFLVTTGPLLWASTAEVSAGDDQRFAAAATVLQQHCLTCHSGPAPKGGFSVVTADDFFADGYVSPGTFSGSHLETVLTSADGAAQMPKNKPPLSAAEMSALRLWIDSGGHWPQDVSITEARVALFDWWSWQPLANIKVPVSDDDWVQTPVDAFIRQRHQQLGLQHNPRADRRTLIRRLTFDLTGLPPTAAEVDQFVHDDAADAYEKLVDRLLASPRYGERWARHWLDVVKYADTHGYDKDKLRHNAWPYRDYVIESFNRDKPWAQFVQEQIAGDTLFAGTPDGIRGLGFLAAGPWDFIGHVEVPESKQDGLEARNLDRDDMVSNTLNAFCSLTVQCARCHNHKFDPITQRDYYGLQAIFAAVDRADRTFDGSAETAQQRQELAQQRADIQAQLDELQRDVEQSAHHTLQQSRARIAALHKLPVRKSERFGYHSQISATADAARWVQLSWPQPVRLSHIVLHPCHDDYNGIGHGFGFPRQLDVQCFDGRQWTSVPDAAIGPAVAAAAGTLAGVTISVDTEVHAIRIVATELASRRGDFIFALAEMEAFDSTSRNVAPGATVTAQDSIEAPARWSRANLTDGDWAKVGVARQIDADTTADTAQQTYEHLVRQYQQQSQAIWTPDRRARQQQLQQQRDAVAAAENALPPRQTVFAAATAFPPQGNFRPTNGTLRPIHVLHRGNVGQPGEAAVPCVVPTAADDRHLLSADLPEAARRAALARWVSDRDNPFVWRSIVNRVWQYHFGRGLVASPNDFGRMGQQPTHPELLDWLAADFRDSGQSLKRLHRMIVMSSTWQQSSQSQPDNAAIDSSNRFLWQYRRRRLDAESIRDSILAVSGALNLQMGGPGYYLFELERTQHSPHYEYHQFDPRQAASHRRSIYRFVVRSQPDPWMTTLDCADSSQSTPTRNETVTPLQALSLLNSPFTLVMAEHFAHTARDAADDLPAQTIHAVRRALQRSPTPAETADLVEYARQHGLTNLCRLLFNLSEFVYVE